MELNSFTGRIVTRATSYRGGSSFFNISVRLGFVVNQGVPEQFLSVYVNYRHLLRKGFFINGLQ
jgi:hypothetical protein